MRRALVVVALAVPIAFGVGTAIAYADTDSTCATGGAGDCPALGPIQNPSSWSASAVEPEARDPWWQTPVEYPVPNPFQGFVA